MAKPTIRVISRVLISPSESEFKIPRRSNSQVKNKGIQVKLPPSPLDIFNDALDGERVFILQSHKGKSDCSRDFPRETDIRDAVSQKIIFRVIYSEEDVSSSKTDSNGNENVKPKSKIPRPSMSIFLGLDISVDGVIRLKDFVSGLTLIRGRKVGNSVGVEVERQAIGSIDELCDKQKRFLATDAFGDPLFEVQMVKRDEKTKKKKTEGCFKDPTEFQFVSHAGQVIGRLGREVVEGGTVERVLRLHYQFDLPTTAILLFAGYFVFVSYFAERKCGNFGTRGISKRLPFWCCFIVSGIFIIVTSIVFISLYFALWSEAEKSKGSPNKSNSNKHR